MFRNIRENNDIGKNKKEHLKFLFTYLLIFIYFYFCAVILKNFASDELTNLIITFVLYIPIYIYIYISSKNRNLYWNDIGFTGESINLVIILSIIYVSLLIFKSRLNIEYIIQGVFFLICTGLPEELMLRGYTYERSKQFMSRRRSIFWNCLLTTLFHMPIKIVMQGLTVGGMVSFLLSNFLMMSLFSIIFIIIKEKTKTIWTPVILHSIINFIQII